MSKLLIVVVTSLLTGCSFYPAGSVPENGYGSLAEELCASANEWTRTCGFEDGPRPLLDVGACVSRLDAVDDEVLEFNVWCYARYRAYRFCEPLARTNREVGYWQPTLSLPELGCVDEWPDDWLAGP